MSKSNKRNQKKNQKQKGGFQKTGGFQVPGTPGGNASPATNLFLQTPPYSPESPASQAKGAFLPPPQTTPSFSSPAPFELSKTPPNQDESTKAPLTFGSSTPFQSMFGTTTPSAGFSFPSSQTPFQPSLPASSMFTSTPNAFSTFAPPSSTAKTNPVTPSLVGPSEPPKFSPSQLPTTSSSFSFSNSPDVSVFSSFMSTLPKPNEQKASVISGINFSFSNIEKSGNPIELPTVNIGKLVPSEVGQPGKTEQVAKGTEWKPLNTSLESSKTSSNIQNVASAPPPPVQSSKPASQSPKATPQVPSVIPPKVVEQTPAKKVEQPPKAPPQVPSLTSPKVAQTSVRKVESTLASTKVEHTSTSERSVTTPQVERTSVSTPKVDQTPVTAPRVERTTVSSPKVDQVSVTTPIVDRTISSSQSVKKERTYFIVDADSDINKQKRKQDFDSEEKSKKFKSDFIVSTDKLDLSHQMLHKFSSNVLTFLKKIGLNLTGQSIQTNDLPKITRYEKEIDEIGTTVNIWKDLLTHIPGLISKSQNPEKARELCYLTMNLIENDVTSLKQILNFKEATPEQQFQWIKEFGTYLISYLSEPTGANHIDSLKSSGVDVPTVTIPNKKTSFTFGDCSSNLENELENNGISKKLIQTEIMDVLQKQQIVGTHPLVTRDDLLALRFFTRGDPEIRTANSLLRDLTSLDKHKRTLALEKSKNYTNLIYHTQRAILNLPGPERSILVYRGDSSLPVGINEWKAGTEIVWNSFTVCVESASFALNFAAGQVLYVIELEATQGCSLRHYSQFPSEKEYLLPAFCKFKVLNISQEKNVGYQVHLKCLYIDEMCYLQK